MASNAYPRTRSGVANIVKRKLTEASSEPVAVAKCHHVPLLKSSLLRCAPVHYVVQSPHTHATSSRKALHMTSFDSPPHRSSPQVFTPSSLNRTTSTRRLLHCKPGIGQPDCLPVVHGCVGPCDHSSCPTCPHGASEGMAIIHNNVMTTTHHHEGTRCPFKSRQVPISRFRFPITLNTKP